MIINLNPQGSIAGVATTVTAVAAALSGVVTVYVKVRLYRQNSRLIRNSWTGYRHPVHSEKAIPITSAAPTWIAGPAVKNQWTTATVPQPPAPIAAPRVAIDLPVSPTIPNLWWKKNSGLEDPIRETSGHGQRQKQRAHG